MTLKYYCNSRLFNCALHKSPLKLNFTTIKEMLIKVFVELRFWNVINIISSVKEVNSYYKYVSTSKYINYTDHQIYYNMYYLYL